MRVAIYGGSFNPPHVAHAMVASWVRWTGAADAVWLVPVFRHAFEDRHGKVLAPFAMRSAWCRAMCAEIGGAVEVCEIEAELPVPSYTLDTLQEHARRHPEHRFRLVVGADVLPQVHAWKGWDQICAGYDPIVVGRVGSPAPGGDVVSFPNISSTEIRARLAAGQEVGHLVPASVRRQLLVDAPEAWRPPQSEG